MVYPAINLSKLDSIDDKFRFKLLTLSNDPKLGVLWPYLDVAAPGISALKLLFWPVRLLYYTD